MPKLTFQGISGLVGLRVLGFEGFASGPKVQIEKPWNAADLYKKLGWGTYTTASATQPRRCGQAAVGERVVLSPEAAASGHGL